MSITIEAVNFVETFVNVLRTKAVLHTPVTGTLHGNFIAEVSLRDMGDVRIAVVNSLTTDDRQKYRIIIESAPVAFGTDSIGHVFTIQQGDTVLADDDSEHQWAERIMKYILRHME
ncbi:hypothetical protein NVP2275O_104 [Vibrio phage 2.275.O._10N.286.54.E11]|nr:hypothetical protein NVP2275O_104 [Vibrio phage 2.275.O._10N.286.54.E11]